jgi:hypothetical protein
MPSRSFEVDEDPEIPSLSILFGWGPMVPFVLGAVAVWVMHPNMLAVRLTVLWGGAILVFLAGVRRGLSFRTPNSPRWQQIATMIWLFCLGVCALATSDQPSLAIPLLFSGFTSVALLDPIAAERGEVPLFFARLRPLQMLVPIISLCAIAARLWRLA